MKILRLQNFVILISLLLLGVACSDSSTGGMENTQKATFNGKVESTNSQSSSKSNSLSVVQGAVVTAAQVTADGSLQTIGDAQAETNAQGQYTLQVDVSTLTNASNKVVIVAENSGEKAKAFVSGEVRNGATFTVQPITFESSAEAEVFQKVVANGDDDVVTHADIEATVESNVAADIESNTQNAAKIAAALASSAQAKADFYADKGIEISQDQRDQIIEAKQEAQVQLASELNTASSATEKQTAFDTFIEAVAKAELNADVQAWAVAESDDFAARVLVKESADLSADAQSEIRKYASFYTAVALNAAVQAEAKVVNASDATINALEDAGATLQANVKSTTNASKGQIDSFFVQFNEDIQAALNSDTNIDSSAFVTVNTSISGSSGLKTTLESTLNATSNLNTMLNAYSNFSSGVKSIVDTSFVGASDAEAQAYTRLLVLINIAS